MKTGIAILFLLIVLRNSCTAQNYGWRDSLLHELNIVNHDTDRVLLWTQLGNYYKFVRPDSGLFYTHKALALAREMEFHKGQLEALLMIALLQNILGNHSKALQITLQGLKIAESNNLSYYKARFLGSLAFVYNELGDHTKALNLFRASKTILDSLHEFSLSALRQRFIGQTFLQLNQPDSALYYCQASYENGLQLKESWLIYDAMVSLGKIYTKKGNADLGLAYLRQSLSMADEPISFFNSYFAIAESYRQLNNPDSCIYYAGKSLEAVEGRGFYSNIVDANLLLSAIYETRDPQKAIQHSKMALSYKDSLYNLGKKTSFESFIAFDEQERQYEIENAKATYRSQIKQYVLIAGLLVFLMIAFILYRNNRNKQKAKEKIEKAYDSLKATQTQLIQSEKMASLGELTAGVAHEIQNPLNFVNNFSDVNKELLSEMKDEIRKGNQKKAELIADDVIANEEKINQHGMKADAIVKNMLQHSRGTSGKKELTDINALADEYLRMAYHGQRAKDKSFIAKIETDFDSSIGKINIVPQDIGRVFINLLSNAFYAVSEKTNPRVSRYEPRVIVSTKKSGDKVEIMIEDNGSGIPKKIVDKIFQPFFTTKPTGQGTGLGLSLVYDIITKGHGGELKVETKQGEGSEFIIQIPIKDG